MYNKKTTHYILNYTLVVFKILGSEESKKRKTKSGPLRRNQTWIEKKGSARKPSTEIVRGDKSTDDISKDTGTSLTLSPTTHTQVFFFKTTLQDFTKDLYTSFESCL